MLLETEADLFTLGELANILRERKNATSPITTSMSTSTDQHLRLRCVFCAFGRLKSPRGYVMSDDQILERAGRPMRELHRTAHRRRAAPPETV